MSISIDEVDDEAQLHETESILCSSEHERVSFELPPRFTAPRVERTELSRDDWIHDIAWLEVHRSTRPLRSASGPLPDPHRPPRLSSLEALVLPSHRPGRALLQLSNHHRAHSTGGAVLELVARHVHLAPVDEQDTREARCAAVGE